MLQEKRRAIKRIRSSKKSEGWDFILADTGGS